MMYLILMDAQICARCRKPLAAHERGRVPAAVRLAAAIATAFLHGGLWANEELSRPYCSRCLRSVACVALLWTALVLLIAALGAFLWLRGPGRASLP